MRRFFCELLKSDYKDTQIYSITVKYYNNLLNRFAKILENICYGKLLL